MKSVKLKIETYKRGFTLIELLVVIAIVGVLSAIVLSSLNSSRLKANDARVKSQLGSFKRAAELYYDTQNPNSYGISVVGNESQVLPNFGNGCSNGMFTDSTIDRFTTVANYLGGSSMKCTSVGGTSYVITVNLQAVSGYWCVDNSGNSRLTTTGLAQANSATVCP
jgi:prepilin-type N-terminal cleavage/methylation domain-containing protein